MKVKLIACSRLWREWALAAALSPHQVQLNLLDPEEMRGPQLPAMASHTAGLFDLVLIGAGSCANEEGRLARLPGSAPLVLPRAADCTALLVGERRRYAALFEQMGEEVAWQLPDHAAGCSACTGCRGGQAVRLRGPLGPRAQAVQPCALELVGELGWVRALADGPWEDEGLFCWLPGMR